MNSYEEDLKEFQAAAIADLQKELAKKSPDPLRTERKMFAASLVKARLKSNLSQAKLADKLGLQQPAISRIENGRSNPSLGTLLAIAKALGVDIMLEYKH